jgi:integrase/recombinase XerD
MEMPKRIEYFMNYTQQIKSKTYDTAYGYAVDICLFFRWYLKTKDELTDIDVKDVDILGVDDELIKNLKCEDVEAFITYIEKERGNGLSTKAHKIASLKQFFKYIYKKCRLLNENIAEDLTAPKIHRKDPEYLSEEDGIKILNYIANSNSKNKIRDFTMIYLYFANGLRLNELIQIDFKDIELEKKTIKTIGKGNKPATIYLNEQESIDIITSYMEWRKTIHNEVKKESKEAVFVSNKHGRISERTVQNMFKKYIKAIGLDEKKYHIHSMRHSYCMNLYNKGYDLRTMQQLMRHDNISTTTFYFRAEEKKLREANNGVTFGVKIPQVSTK